MVTVIATALPA